MSQEVETLPSVEGDLLHIRYVPLSSALLWDRNPKKHDIQKLVESIELHGFRDPPAYDARLGAFVEGNGRTEALQWMAAQGRERPRGIGLEVQSGEWALPVLFGVDAESRLAAERYGIDHNNLTLAGGDFTTFDYARVWDHSYIDILRDMAEQGAMPVSVDGDDLDALIRMAQPAAPSLDDLAELAGEHDERSFWPTIKIQVPPEVYDTFQRLMNRAEGANEVEKFTSLLALLDDDSVDQ